MDESESSEKPDKIGRRDFLKVAGTATAGALVPKQLTETGKQKEKKEEPEAIEVKTKFGNYYPMYESHIRRAVADDIKKIPVPDLHFQEGVIDFNYLKLKGLKIDITSTPPIKVEFTDKLIEYLKENEINLAFENSELPPNLSIAGDASIFGETAAGLLLLIKKAKKLKEDRDVESAKEFLGANLVNLWTSTGITATSAQSIPEIFTDIPDSAPLLKTLRKISATNFRLHPEFMNVYFINVIIARRLKKIGQELSRSIENKDKPNISFVVGGAHSGIEDLLHSENLVNNSSLTLLNIYPDSVLRQIVEHNKEGDESIEKGIEKMSKITTYKILETGDKVALQSREFVDEELKQYLETRLLEQSGEQNPSR